MIVEIDGASRHDIDCGHCIHFNPETEVCNIAHQSDEKTSPFCGQICGYFKFREGGGKNEQSNSGNEKKTVL